MAAIPGFRFDITGASGSQGLLSPRQSWQAYVFPRGANASQDSTGTLITFDSATIASRFSVNNWVQVSTDTSKIRKVTAVGGNSMSVNAAVTVTENDRVFLIGNTQPSVVGGSATYITPNTLVRQRGDDTADLYANSMITTNVNGLVQGYASPAMYDVLVQDGNGSAQGYVQDLMVGIVEGVSVTDWAFFGSTVTFHGAIGVTGIAQFGSTITIVGTSGNYSHTGTAKFGNTVTVNGYLGVTSGIVTPRLGQQSSATTGGALRFIDGVVFPLTVAGVQAALDEVETSGGGVVNIPSAAGISVSTTSVKIPNRVRLCGTGDHTSVATFIATNSANVASMIENKNQDGTQQYAYVEHLSVNGNKSGGAAIGAGIRMSYVYVGSRMKDVLVTECSGNGIYIGGQSFGTGQIVLDNIVVTTSNDDNILITGPVNQVYGFQIGSESVAAGKAQIRIAGSSNTASFGHVLIGLNFEGTVACEGLVLDGCANVLVDSIVDNGSGAATNLVRISGTTTGSDGAFAAGGHTIRNAQANLTTIISDQVAGVTVSNAQGRFVRLYQSPVFSYTLDRGQVVGLQVARIGGSTASAQTISPDATNYNFLEITGTTDIQTITANERYSGKPLTLMWSNASPGDLGTGGNVRLAGGVTFSPAQWDAITLVCSGKTWFEGSPR